MVIFLSFFTKLCFSLQLFLQVHVFPCYGGRILTPGEGILICPLSSPYPQGVFVPIFPLSRWFIDKSTSPQLLAKGEKNRRAPPSLFPPSSLRKQSRNHYVSFQRPCNFRPLCTRRVFLARALSLYRVNSDPWHRDREMCLLSFSAVGILGKKS